MSQSLTKILGAHFFGLSVVYEETANKLNRLAEENEHPSRWVGDDRSESKVASDELTKESERLGLYDDLFGIAPDFPLEDDETSATIVEASMAPIDATASELSGPTDAEVAEFSIRTCCLAEARKENGTSVFELEKAGHDKAAVKKALRELVMEHKLTTSGQRKGTRYHAVKGMEAAE